MVKTKPFLPALLATAALVLSLGIVGLGAGMVHASTFGTMQGKVTDAAGQPVAGVKISLAGEGAVTTDKSGSFILDGIDPGIYQLAATKKGYKTSTLSVTILQDVPQEIDVTMAPQ